MDSAQATGQGAPPIRPFAGVTDQFTHVSRCPGCGHEDLLPWLTRLDSVPVLQCPQCKLGVVAYYPTDLGALYDSEYFSKSEGTAHLFGYKSYSDLSPEFFLWNACLLKLVSPRAKSVFDIGAAEGSFLETVRRVHSAKFAGIEFNAECAAKARSLGLDVMQGDVLKLQEIVTERYDVVTAWAFLEHIPQLDTVLRNAHAITTDDGFFCFEVPIIVGDPERDKIFLSTSLEHIFYFTEESLRTLLGRIFAGGCFGRAITYPGCCGTFAGVCSKAVLAPNSAQSQALQAMQDPALTALDLLSVDQILGGGAFHMRYTRDWQAASILLKEGQKRDDGMFGEKIALAFGSELAGTSKVAEDFYVANEWFKSQHAAHLRQLEEHRGAEEKLRGEVDEFQSRVSALSQEIERSELVRATRMKTIESLRAQRAAARERAEAIRDCEQARQETEALRAHARGLESYIAGLQQTKVFRLRRTWSKRPRTLASVLLSGYLVTAMIIPEAIRARFRRPLGEWIRRWQERRGQALPLPPAEVVNVDPLVDRPLLSVIMPCYNYGRFIREALESVYRQTFQNFEVLVVDCSDDGETREILKTIRHPKVTIHYREGRHLLGDNRNFGIERARGRYVCSLDPDDILEPTYFEKALYVLEQGNFDIVSPSLREFGQSHGEWILNPRPPPRQFLLTNQNSVVGIYRKSLWEKAGRFHDFGVGTEYVFEDWEFWLRAALSGARMMNLREVLLNYRMHGNNMSKARDLQSLERMRETMLGRIKERISERALQDAELNNARRLAARNGTVNLLDKKPYRPDSKSIMFVLPYAIVGGAAARAMTSAKLFVSRGYRVTFLFTEEMPPNAGCNRAQFEAISKDVFDLPRILGQELDWLPFVEYLIQSRSISSCILVGSNYFYQSLPSLKQSYPLLNVLDMQFNCDCHLQNNRSYSRWINVTIAENPEVLEALEEKRAAPDERFILIENGVDAAVFADVRQDKALRPKEIPQDAFVVGYLGRLSHEKAPDFFVDLAAYLAHHSNYFFVLAGPGPMHKQIVEQIEAYDLQSRIFMPGFTDSKDFFSWVDVLVMPSRIDGRPNAILEAMACGVPVVASNIGGIPSIISHPGLGRLCDSEDIAGFASAIEEFADNPALRLAIGAQAKAQVALSLDDARLLPRFLALIEEAKATEEEPTRELANS